MKLSHVVALALLFAVSVHAQTQYQTVTIQSHVERSMKQPQLDALRKSALDWANAPTQQERNSLLFKLQRQCEDCEFDRVAAEGKVKITRERASGPAVLDSVSPNEVPVPKAVDQCPMGKMRRADGTCK